jgi:diguanylate cyclase (GGDEF)-like protein
VLQEVARLIRDAVRSVDIVGRIGGEEFAAVLVEMDEDSARDVAERVRCMVEEASIAVPEGVPVRVTISIGITHLRGRNANLDTLLSEADTAMYAAKEGGRNSVVVSN